MGFWDETIFGEGYFCGVCRGLGFCTLEYLYFGLYVAVHGKGFLFTLALVGSLSAAG